MVDRPLFAAERMTNSSVEILGLKDNELVIAQSARISRHVGRRIDRDVEVRRWEGNEWHVSIARKSVSNDEN